MRVGSNHDNPTIPVYWHQLEREVNGYNNQWKSECPFCNIGLFLLGRNDDGILKEIDCCVHCGQHVLYLDIEDMRRFDWEVGCAPLRPNF